MGKLTISMAIYTIAMSAMLNYQRLVGLRKLLAMECGQLNAIKNIKELHLGMVEIPAIRMVTGGWFYALWLGLLHD